jgi:DNA-directed RNA polymerase specialized sigma24 family protein
MMTCLSKHQAVVDLLADDELRELAVRICHRYADDLIQEVAMVILEMDEDKWTNVNDGGYLRYYVVRTMMTMATSPRSTFARKHDLFAHSKQVPDIADDADGYDWDQEDDMMIIEALLDSYHWYDKEVLRLWLQEGSYRKVGKKVDIPFKSIGNSVRRTLDQLKEDYYGIILQRCISSGHRVTTDRSDKHPDLH